MSYYTIIQCDKCGTSLYHKGIASEDIVAQKILKYNWKIINGQLLCDECISEKNIKSSEVHLVN